MALVKTGDQKAFRILFEHYRGPVMSYLYSLVHDRSIAEELTQETFLKVYRARASYEPQKKFVAWLWTIARNSAMDRLRQKSEWTMDESSEFESVPDPRQGSDEQLIENASREQVQRCLEGLTPAQRDALMLRTVSELSYDEIAAQIGTTLSSVKSLINRAKAALVRCVAGQEGGSCG